jgi:hypothetical protein
MLRGLSFDDEILSWVRDALRASHGDEKQYHADAITRLSAESTKLQQRIEAMYEDKLDGKVDAAYFEKKSADWRADQNRLLQKIQEHQTANQNYLTAGVQLLELANCAGDLFEKQQPREKRRLLDFVLSNSTWKSGVLTPTYRQPFDLIAESSRAHQMAKAAGVAPDGLRQRLLPIHDNSRTNSLTLSFVWPWSAEAIGWGRVNQRRAKALC